MSTTFTIPAADAIQVIDQDTWSVVLTFDPRRVDCVLTATSLEVTLPPDIAWALTEALDVAGLEPALCRWCRDGATLAANPTGLCDPHQDMA